MANLESQVNQADLDHQEKWEMMDLLDLKVYLVVVASLELKENQERKE